MVCNSISYVCNGPAESKQVMSFREAAAQPLTPRQVWKLKAILLLCVGLFLVGVAATSGSEGFSNPGAGVRLAVAPPGMTGR